MSYVLGNFDGTPEVYSSALSLAACCKATVLLLSLAGYTASMYSSSRVHNDLTKTYHHK